MRGDSDQATALLARARELYSELPDRLGLAAVDNARGRVALAGGDSRLAAQLFTRAADAACEIGSPLEEGIALIGLGRTALLQNDERRCADLRRASSGRRGSVRSTV